MIFVSYAHHGGFGWAEVRRPMPQNGDDVEYIVKKICEREGIESAIPISFQEFAPTSYTGDANDV